jgi:hypothetical protein
MAKRRNKMAFEKRRREQKKRQKRAEKLERKHQRGAGGEYGEQPPDEVLVEVDPVTGDIVEVARSEEAQEGEPADERRESGGVVADGKEGVDPDSRS